MRDRTIMRNGIVRWDVMKPEAPHVSYHVRRGRETGVFRTLNEAIAFQERRVCPLLE